MKRALLDTNIIIHRENIRLSNVDIGNLFYWLDKLHYLKIIHPLTVEEINKYNNDENVLKLLQIKLNSYEILKTSSVCSKDFLNKISLFDKTKNDEIDNSILYELYIGTVDILITEDKKLREKAKLLNIRNKVFSISEFLCDVTEKYPTLVQYKSLDIETAFFGNIDLDSQFFDSFKKDYREFSNWFRKKSNEEAYICRDDKKDILGFLYLKVEDERENYKDIIPEFIPRRRLKVGTFKVISTGFRLGERFIKIIFDNAIKQKVEEIYVTLFENRPELQVLSSLLEQWGFERHGHKVTINGQETVFVKKMIFYDSKKTIQKNFPNLFYNKQKFLLPISSIYHTRLLPDSILNNEKKINFIGKEAQKYALKKVYITWTIEKNINVGDFILFYRMGDKEGNKKYTSVITSIGVIENINFNFENKEQYLKECQNRSVFTREELEQFWIRHRNNLKIIKFIFIKSLTNKLTLEYLWKNKVVNFPNGPRPFTKISDGIFNKILIDSKTEVKFFYN